MGNSVNFYFRFHLALAAFRAIALLRSGLIDAARALPPIFPPRRPSAAITRWTSSSDGSSATPSVLILTRWCANWFTSGSASRIGVTLLGVRLDFGFTFGLAILPAWHVCLTGSSWPIFKVAHYPFLGSCPKSVIDTALSDSEPPRNFIAAIYHCCARLPLPPER